ncbi:MAG: T9SS type A sorting domain-containing protein [Saprospiraceae bacterium]|nr:T9SS type A sorting domain-containing protein [Saprospiraceae bacterium]
MIRFSKNILSYFIILAFQISGLSQECKKPFLARFNNGTTKSVGFKWSDNNVSPIGWEIELVKRGSPKTGVPNIPITAVKEVILTDLIPCTAYEIFIRTVCSTDVKSIWNGPYLYTTICTNPTNCQISLPIKDNGLDSFSIDIKETGIIGTDIFIESIDMIIEHDWPADLKIILESPKKQQVVLSNHNGTGTDDFGDVNDLTCSLVTSFNQNACKNLKANKPPFLGSFKPDGNLGSFALNTPASGIWKLIFFDRAIKDIGTLKYFNINFSREQCTVPENFVITAIGNNSVTVDFDPFIKCQTAKIIVTQIDKPPREIVFNCNEPNLIIGNLLPNTDYEISIKAGCGTTPSGVAILSEESCKYNFTTTCEKATLSESFDNKAICVEGCAIPCLIGSEIWYNVTTEITQDWIVWQGDTDTENTGPSSGVNGTGNYIYIESNPSICGANNKVILQSKCIDIKSNASGCDMSFYYHMYGSDIANLTLEISVDGGFSWQELIKFSGNKGDKWNRSTISLANYDGLTAYFRFVGTSSQGVMGDIALDQIEFYKSTIATNLIRYYVDSDADGYGLTSDFIDVCTSNIPFGYSDKGGDCDDQNQNIHPNVTEIQCNGIDENCNGNEDDQPSANPINLNIQIQNESCQGSFDGKIELSITGGNAPYFISWNNNTLNGAVINNLTSGIYQAVITDIGGCIKKTEYLQLVSNTSLNAIVTSLTRPSCLGKSDGSIAIQHTTGNEPYRYVWSDGNTTKNLNNIPEATYSVTISDVLNCSVVIENIMLIAKPSITTDIKSIKHPSCFGQKDGNVEIIVSNGKSPYKYLWNTGATTTLLTGLGAGSYTCTVMDDNGCKSNFHTILNQPDSLYGQLISNENVRCFGEANGSIKTKIFGGTPPYTYILNGLPSNASAPEISAGTYFMVVTDHKACSITLPPIIITQPQKFEITIDSIRPSNCILGKNGYLSLNTTGGTPEYNYSWNHIDQSSFVFDNLLSGDYSITAYDRSGCKSTLPNIYVPFVNIPVLAELEVIQENKCYNDKQAILSAHIINGIGPYDYNWSQGIQYIKNGINDTLVLLPSGPYQLTITDAEGCVGISEQIILEEKDPFYYNVGQIVENKCSSDLDGSIEISITGGEMPLNVSWNEGMYFGPFIQSLPNGLYKALITDKNECQLICESINLTSNSDIKVNAAIINDINNTKSGEVCLIIEGGVLPYTLNWSSQIMNNNCISGLHQGTYTVTITDALECQKVYEFVVQNTSSTTELTKNEFIIFPNPTTGIVYIKSNQIFNRFNIYSTEGKLIKTATISEDNSIDLSDLRSGLYFLECNIESGKFRKKVLIFE